jgi:hypothetical protein
MENNTLLVIATIYFIPMLLGILLAYLDNTIETFGDFLTCWELFTIPLFNIVVSWVLIAEVYIKFWNRIKNIKIK